MDLLTSWVLAPILLAALAAGWGMLLELACGRRLSRALLLPGGLAALIVVGQFTTLLDATAELTAPLAAIGAAVGLVFLVARWRAVPAAGWAIAAAAAVFCVYAAPIVASGEATFAGYIRLDDTATWMALTDRVMEHGRSLDGLAASTYQLTLEFNLGDGYPVGVFVPLGILTELTGIDVAWLVQPYMACLAAALAASLWSLARSAGAGPGVAAAASFVASGSALLFGYYLWGGIKEVAAAAMVAALAATIAWLAAQRFAPRAILAPAIVCAAIVGILSEGGVIWALPALLVGGLLALRELGPRAAGLRAAVCTVAVGILSLPVLLVGGLRPPTSSSLADDRASGNLIGPVEPAQAAGVWPSGDFRLDPVAEPVVFVLIAVAIAAAAGGVAWLAGRGAWAALAYVGGALVSALVLWLVGSPWVDGKALATASPAVPFAAVLAAGALIGTGRRVPGLALLVCLGAAIVWSNALAYRDVNLAPRGHLEELEALGERLGPADAPVLITEYQPYGARHFLRDADPEAVSELRRRLVPLANGEGVPKGLAADTDALDPVGLLAYRTLVVRRSPSQSRPPAAYRLIWRGDVYEAWRRSTSVPSAQRLALGSVTQPTAVPRCAEVKALAASAGRGGLVAAERSANLVVDMSRASFPRGWVVPDEPSHPVPDRPGVLEATVRNARPSTFDVWLGGSVRPRVDLEVDGEQVGSVRHELNNGGGYVHLGEIELAPGPHRIGVRFAGSDLHPGSGGVAGPIGPLVLSREEAAETTLTRVAADRAQRLCGRAWDWIEVAG